MGTQRNGFTKEQKEEIQKHPWDGNIRELQGVIERYVIFEEFELNNKWHNNNKVLTSQIDGNDAHPYNFEEGLFAFAPRTVRMGLTATTAVTGATLKELEKAYIQHVLERTGGKIYGENGALSILGLSKSTLYKRISEYKIK